MARPVEFDRKRALESAMKLFWQRGYGAASLSQLLEVMEIGKSSFYAAFTDKRALYAEALDLFGNRTLDKFIEIKQQHSALDTVQLFFEDTIFNVPKRRMRRGCLMVNSILELSDVDQELCDLASQKLNKIESEFTKAFTDDLKTGKLNFSQSPKDMARFVMTINQGLRVSSRKNISKNELRHSVKTAMDTLRFALTQDDSK